MRDEDLSNAELAAEIARIRERLGKAERPAESRLSAGQLGSQHAEGGDRVLASFVSDASPCDWFGPGRMFEGAFLINLDSRPERLSRSVAELDRYGLGDCVTRMPAFRHEHGMYGCSVSHLEAVRYARWKGWRSVLILEDDIRFSADFAQDAAQALHDLALQKWGVFQFGALNPDNIEFVTPHLFRFRGAAGAHAVALHERVFDFVIERYVCELDRGNWDQPSHLPFDEYVNNYLADEFETFASVKLLISQYPGRSDTLGNDVDYRPYLEDAYENLESRVRASKREK